MVSCYLEPVSITAYRSRVVLFHDDLIRLIEEVGPSPELTATVKVA
jgi:hypothetical protein